MSGGPLVQGFEYRMKVAPHGQVLSGSMAEDSGRITPLEPARPNQPGYLTGADGHEFPGAPILQVPAGSLPIHRARLQYLEMGYGEEPIWLVHLINESVPFGVVWVAGYDQKVASVEDPLASLKSMDTIVVLTELKARRMRIEAELVRYGRQ